MISPTLRLEVTVCGWSPLPEDPFNTPAASGKVLKDSVIHWKLPIMTGMFENSKSQTTLLKIHEKIFSLADECEENDSNDKVSDILRTSKCSVQAYINGHERYAKAKGMKLRKDSDVTDFFTAVSLAPKKVSGMIYEMDDPTKKARASEAVSPDPCSPLRVQHILTTYLGIPQVLARSQHALAAGNKLSGKQTSRSELADKTPIRPEALALTELVRKHSSKLSNSKEGFRIYNPQKNTEAMQMNYAHLTTWAEEIVSTHVFLCSRAAALILQSKLILPGQGGPRCRLRQPAHVSDWFCVGISGETKPH